MVNQTAETPPTLTLSWRGPFARWPRASDAVLAIAVFALALFVVEGATEGDLVIRSLEDVPPDAFLVFVVASGALVWRRSQPVVVFAVTVGATLLSTLFGHSEVIGFSFVIALYSVSHYSTNARWAHVALGTAILVALSSPITDPEAGVGDAVFGVFFLSFIWYLGGRMRFRGDRAAQIERERVADAARALAEERTRIARELHDVVAHHVSLMTVQAGAAKTVVADDPEGAFRAMEAVEEAGRQALDELRHLLGVLRPEAETHGLAPQPGLSDIQRLVDQFKEAGLDVSLTMEGVEIDLPARVDLSAYRIVQEALTNVLKHAGPGARAEALISADNTGVTIEVIDNGPGITILPGSGHGIDGMRERATLLSGTLDAGPRSGAGFRVASHLPIGEEQR